MIRYSRLFSVESFRFSCRITTAKPFHNVPAKEEYIGISRASLWASQLSDTDRNFVDGYPGLESAGGIYPEGFYFYGGGPGISVIHGLIGCGKLVYNIAVAGAFCLSELLKRTFQHARPPLPWLTSAIGYSFPSGLAYLVFRNSQWSRLRYIIAVVLLLLPVMIGISRILLYIVK